MDMFTTTIYIPLYHNHIVQEGMGMLALHVLSLCSCDHIVIHKIDWDTLLLIVWQHMYNNGTFTSERFHALSVQQSMVMLTHFNHTCTSHIYLPNAIHCSLCTARSVASIEAGMNSSNTIDGATYRASGTGTIAVRHRSLNVASSVISNYLHIWHPWYSPCITSCT